MLVGINDSRMDDSYPIQINVFVKVLASSYKYENSASQSHK